MSLSLATSFGNVVCLALPSNSGGHTGGARRRKTVAPDENSISYLETDVKYFPYLVIHGEGIPVAPSLPGAQLWTATRRPTFGMKVC